MVIFFGTNRVHFPHQKIEALEQVLLAAKHIDSIRNSTQLIRDEGRNFLSMYDDNAPIWYETAITRDKFKQYFKVAECYANKTGHFELKQISLFSSVCEYCKTVEFETESSEVMFD